MESALAIAISLAATSASALVIDFFGGTAYLSDGTSVVTSDTMTPYFYDNVDCYVEDGVKFDFVGGNGIIGRYYDYFDHPEIQNSVIHSHWDELSSMVISMVDGSTFDLFAGSISHASAGVISQEMSNGGFQMNSYETFGQSFTAIDNSAITFSLMMEGVNVDFPHTDNLIATLYDGEGFGGAVLSTDYMLMPNLYEDDGAWLVFDFSDAFLSMGNIYTVGFFTDGDSPYGGVRINWDSNIYSGGSAYLRNSLDENSDLSSLLSR